MVASAVNGRQLGSQQIARLLIVAVVGGVIVFGVLFAPDFLTVHNLRGVFRNAALTGIVAAGMTPVTLSGNFVSLGTQQTAVGAAMLFITLVTHGLGVPLAIVVIVLAVIAVGLVQGAIIAAGLNAIITTLAAGSIILAIASYYSTGQYVELGNHAISWGNSSFAGIPTEVYVMIVFTAIVTVFVHGTGSGRKIILTGANKSTARQSGISFFVVTAVAFTLFSIGIAFAAILYAAGTGSATPNSMATLTIDVVAALLLGGIAIGGGNGSPWRSAAGAVFISLITNVMILKGIDSGQSQAIEGAIVVLVVALLTVAQRQGSRT